VEIGRTALSAEPGSASTSPEICPCSRIRRKNVRICLNGTYPTVDASATLRETLAKYWVPLGIAPPSPAGGAKGVGHAHAVPQRP
jgi:hypothetical protein